MHRLRLWVRNVFGFSSGEANGFLILLPLMVLLLFSEPIYEFLTFNKPVENQDNGLLDSLVAHWNFNPELQQKENVRERFQFDPNTATVDELIALGISNYLSVRIVNYRLKGGRFRNEKDLLKIYGMDTSLVMALTPYINIPPIAEKKVAQKLPNRPDNKTRTAPLSFDLNQADTSQLKSIYGIGPVLAGRIVKYRNALGGYVDSQQLEEVFGLDTAVVKRINSKFYIDPAYIPQQLDLNKVTFQELSRHPYIKAKLAKTIIAYRFQHGSFTEIDDLLKIDLIDQKVLDRIRVYMKIEN